MPIDDSVIPVQSRRFSAREICELALRKIGAFAINDEAANDTEMEVALQCYEIIVSEIATIMGCWFLIPESFRFYWPGPTATGTVAEIMADIYPAVGIQRPIRATLIDANGVRCGNLPMVRRAAYDSVDNKSTQGRPELLYFDSLALEPEVSIYRVPQDGVTWQVELEAQVFPKSILGEQINTDQSGDVRHDFGVGWQHYMVNKLASVIGDGPVRQKQRQDLEAWETKSQNQLAELIAWDNRERRSTLARTQRWGGDNRSFGWGGRGGYR